MASPPLRMAIDVGGTFTDTVVVDQNNSVLASAKTLTTPANPADGAMEGAVRAMAAAGRRLDELTGFIHGTTLATNALIEKRGATVATVTTEGFRDILEIAYERRYAQYDINLEKPDLLVSRERACPGARVGKGDVVIPLDDGSVEQLVDALDASGAEAVAICLLHAYANPHMNAASEILRQAARLSVSIIEVSPEAREFDRLCTTLANAYIRPLMARYLLRFETQFAAAELTCPDLMMTAGGGMCTIATAAEFPIRLVSPVRPAGDPRGQDRGGRLDRVLSFDVGGTTAKFCLITVRGPGRRGSSRSHGRRASSRFGPPGDPGDRDDRNRAGGGSIAGVDRLGRLTVGPRCWLRTRTRRFR